MAQLPDGEPLPPDGALPSSVTAGAVDRTFGVYLHVPYCRVRCGYCDFNTYTAAELGGGASQASFADTATKELQFARGVLERAELPKRAASTVFFGGGTPTILPAGDLVRLLGEVRSNWGLASGVEVTTEANPDSVDQGYLSQLSDGGFTRVSIGMQSAVNSVLRTLDRTHNPERVAQAVQWAHKAGLEASVDLIYGTPGETLEDWRTSLEAAIATGANHISAYALTVEPGTKLAAQVRRGVLPTPEDDDEADKYELADQILGQAGYNWYEISNWSRTPEQRSAHNLAYWRGDDWWGIGPGAHSHAGGVRWWNVKHPRRYEELLSQGVSPGAGRELLSDQQQYEERVLLQIRLAEGLVISSLREEGRRAVAGLIADGLVAPAPAFPSAPDGGRLVLTLRGRLLADTVVQHLLSA